MLERAPALIRGNGELIMVVDDEESVRTVARTALERFGYRILLAANGAQAFAAVAGSTEVAGAADYGAIGARAGAGATNGTANGGEPSAGPVVQQRHADAEPGRNDPCWCGSGKKFKKCHGA